MYTEKFVNLLKITAVGMAISAVVVLILMYISGIDGSLGSIIGQYIVYTIIYGLCMSALLCTKGSIGLANGVIIDTAKSIVSYMFGMILDGLSGGIVGIIFSFFGIIISIGIAVVLLTPIAIWVFFSYVFRFIYYGIRAFMENRSAA